MSNYNSAMFEHTNCFVCNSSNYLMQFKIENSVSAMNQIDIGIYKCNRCGHVFKNPIFNDYYLREYYTKNQSVFYSNQKKPEISSKKNKTNKAVVSKIEKYINNGKILEIGCGYGFLLSCFDKKRWLRVGIEPSGNALDYLKKKPDLEIHPILFEENNFVDSTFDVIVLIDIIEHIKRPGELFEKANRLLKKNGILFIKTGQINRLIPHIAQSQWSYLYNIEHISFITNSSLKYLCAKYGFEIIEEQNISHNSGILKNLYYLFLAIFKNLFKSVINIILRRRKYLLKIPIVFDHVNILLRKID